MQPSATNQADSFSFQSFIQKLEKSGAIEEIRENVSGYEIAAAASLSSKTCGKALFFSKHRILANLFSSDTRLETALGRSMSEAADISAFFQTPEKSLSFTAPEKYINIGGLADLPLLKHHKHDVSGSINMGCVISKEAHVYNSGIYRIQPLGSDKAVLHCYPGSGLGRMLSSHKKDIPVTIALGCSPHLIYASAAVLPAETDELMLADRLNPAGQKYIETENHPVPHDTEIIIQGRVSVTKKHPEGPFLIHTGEYSDVADFPVLHIDSVSALPDFRFLSTVTGVPPMESAYLGRACARIHFMRISAAHPFIKEIFHPLEGVFFKNALVYTTADKKTAGNILADDMFFGRFENIEIISEQEAEQQK